MGLGCPTANTEDEWNESGLLHSTLPLLQMGAWENSHLHLVDTLNYSKSKVLDLGQENRTRGQVSVLCVSRAQNGDSHSRACSVGIQQGFRNQSVFPNAVRSLILLEWIAFLNAAMAFLLILNITSCTQTPTLCAKAVSYHTSFSRNTEIYQNEKIRKKRNHPQFMQFVQIVRQFLTNVVF